MRLDVSTQAWRRHHFDVLARKHGEKPVAMLQPKHIRKLRDELKDSPVVANIRLKALRALFSWAVEEEEAPHDPTFGVKRLKHVSAGFHSWALHEIEQFEKRHPVGSKARLAMTLLLYTACRREDVVRLGAQHMRDGRLRYRQAKNEHRNPVDLNIPVHPDLKAVIGATPSNHLTFLTTEYGRSFSPAGFGNRFRAWCNDAGLAHCSAHGLRKAAAARLAERGATVHEIMAITGHRSLEEVERYTRAAQQGKLADAAMLKFK
jgi:integrase